MSKSLHKSLKRSVTLENISGAKIARENLMFKTHLLQVANTAVRHMGTLAGNLMIKHTWNAFPSDVFVMLVRIFRHFNEP